MSNQSAAFKGVPQKLEDLEVMFVSAVATPATGERFLLIKNIQGTGFGAWVAQLRKDDPDLAAEMDALLKSERYEELRAMVKSKGGDAAVEQLDARLAKAKGVREVTADYEPTEKDLLGAASDYTPAELVDMIAYKRDWTAEARAKHKEAGGAFAGEGESFPLKTCEDVRAAYMSAGRSKGDPEAVRQNVIAFAKKNSMVECLPQTAQDKIGSKSAGGGVAGGIAAMLAKVAGMEVVPAGTLSTLKSLQTVLADVVTALEKGNDVPAGENVRLLNELIRMRAQAPTDDKGATGSADNEHDQQPSVTLGNPFARSVDAGNIAGGNPFARTVNYETLRLGKPAVKMAGQQTAKKLRDIVEALNDIVR